MNFAELWNFLRFMDEESGDSGSVVIGQVPAEMAVQVAQCYAAIDKIAVLPQFLDVIFNFIMLIINITDDFFNNIFQRHDSLPPAIFINHKGKMLALAAESKQLVTQ